MEESEEKPPPVAWAQSAVSLGDGSVPSWPWPFQWSSLRALSYVSPRAGAAQWSGMAESGEDAGKVQEGTQRVFPGAGAAWEQEEDSSKSWKGENGGGIGGEPHTSQELCLPAAGP